MLRVCVCFVCVCVGECYPGILDVRYKSRTSPTNCSFLFPHMLCSCHYLHTCSVTKNNYNHSFIDINHSLCLQGHVHTWYYPEHVSFALLTYTVGVTSALCTMNSCSTQIHLEKVSVCTATDWTQSTRTRSVISCSFCHQKSISSLSHSTQS